MDLVTIEEVKNAKKTRSRKTYSAKEHIVGLCSMLENHPKMAIKFYWKNHYKSAASARGALYGPIFRTIEKKPHFFVSGEFIYVSISKISSGQKEVKNSRKKTK